jgi:hypothetical protein
MITLMSIAFIIAACGFALRSNVFFFSGLGALAALMIVRWLP